MIGPFQKQDLPVKRVDNDQHGNRYLVGIHHASVREDRDLRRVHCLGYFSTARVHPEFEYYVCRSRMCSSRSCFSATGLGACVRRHCARCVLGKAMTSRMDSAPAIIATMRSRPKAIPPWGGAPYCNASSRKPNFSCASLAPIFKARNTFD